MRHPGVTIFGSLALLIVTLLMALLLSTTQKREVDADRFNIYVTMPTGSTHESTYNEVRVLEERLEVIPEKQDLVVRVNE